jgi:hypothetical protein
MSEQTAETAKLDPRHENEAHAKVDRDVKGRYLDGNPGGPGNPFNRQTAMFKKAIQSATTPDEARALTRKIYDMAMAGNLAAAKIYFTYSYGKPDAVDPDRVDVHELQVLRDTAPLKAECTQLMQAGLPEAHLNMVRIMRPLVSALETTEYAKVLNKTPEDFKREEAAAEAEMERILNSPGPELPDGLEEKLWPRTNGLIDDELPSALDGYGKRPSANGGNRRSKRKKKRKGMPQPSTNGRFHFEASREA